MKKKILRVSIMVVIAITAGWNISQSENEVKLSDLALENVEALTREEAGGDLKSYPCPHGPGEECIKSVNITGPNCYPKHYC